MRDYIGFRVHVEFAPRGDCARAGAARRGEPLAICPVNSRLAKLESDTGLAKDWPTCLFPLTDLIGGKAGPKRRSCSTG